MQNERVKRMAAKPSHSLVDSAAMEVLPTTPQQQKEILELYKTTDDQIKEDVELIKKWKESQPHLPESLSDDFIRNILIRNKCRVERTKQKLDNYFSLRGHHQELIRDFENVVPSKHFNTYLPLSRLTPNLERIIIMRLMDHNPDSYDIMEVIKLNLAVTELSSLYDKSVGVRYLFDFEGFGLKHLLKWNPVAVGKHIGLIERAYSCRMMGIEMVNCPEIANKIVGVMKLFLRPKIYERITIHKDMESIYKVMPKECLPVEYGGDCGNIPDLLKQWDKVFEDHRDFFVENYNNISLEHLRPLEEEKSERFGLDGTFKKLAVD